MLHCQRIWPMRSVFPVRYKSLLNVKWQKEDKLKLERKEKRQRETQSERKMLDYKSFFLFPYKNTGQDIVHWENMADLADTTGPGHTSPVRSWSN